VPTVKPFCSAIFPAATTSPDHSWPGMNGYARGHRPAKLPSMISASVPQIAIARTRHNTSFAAGSGRGDVTDLELVGSGKHEGVHG